MKIKDMVIGDQYVIRNGDLKKTYQWLITHIKGINGHCICFYEDDIKRSYFNDTADFNGDYYENFKDIIIRPATPLEKEWLRLSSIVNKVVDLNSIKLNNVVNDYSLF